MQTIILTLKDLSEFYSFIGDIQGSGGSLFMKSVCYGWLNYLIENYVHYKNNQWKETFALVASCHER